MPSDQTTPPRDPDPPTRPEPPIIAQLPDHALAEMVRSSNPELALSALAELVRHDPLTGTDLAHELVLGHGSDRVRALAALVLGHSDRDSSRSVLRLALDTPEPTLLRRVAQSLGRIGTPEDLPRLAALQPPTPTAVGRDVLMARTLIGYRHGMSDLLVRAPDMVNRLAGHPEAIEFAVPVRDTKARLLDDAAFEAPTLSFTSASVQAFRCSGQPGGLAIDADLSASDLRTTLESPRLLGALLRERPCLERFGLDAWLLADDRDKTDGGRPWLWLVRPDGTVVHAGRATVEAQGASFTITQSCAPYGRPVRVAGTFGGRQVTITEAQVGDYGPSATKAASPEPARLVG